MMPHQGMAFNITRWVDVSSPTLRSFSLMSWWCETWQVQPWRDKFGTLTVQSSFANLEFIESLTCNIKLLQKIQSVATGTFKKLLHRALKQRVCWSFWMLWQTSPRGSNPWQPRQLQSEAWSSVEADVSCFKQMVELMIHEGRKVFQEKIRQSVVV